MLAHDVGAYRELGRLIAAVGKRALQDVADEYIAMLMGALRKHATRKAHTNVLEHLQGYLKDKLDAADKAELLETIHNYRRGQAPLIVPLTLLKHHFRRHPVSYVEKQVYLNPHPPELMLRTLI